MAVDEQQDWTDRAMAQSVWEPPTGFTDRIVVASMAVLPPPPRLRMFSGAWLKSIATGFWDSIRTRIEVSAWIVTQYRELLFG